MVAILSDYLIPLVVTVVAVTVVTVAYHLLKFLGRRSSLARDLVRRVYRPSQLVAMLVALWATLQLMAVNDWHGPVLHGLLLGVIAATGWLVTALLNVLTDAALRKLRLDGRDPISARRIRTRLRVAHRVIIAVVSTLSVAIMLITFEAVRTVGVSLLASAGLVGIVAALAAQSMLSNFFAGVQVAFTDGLRLDDVVVVEGEWGWIEEITLRYVVVKIWDERRLILPTSYFTTMPYENWTKSERKLLGTVELDVDWSVPFEELRVELRQVLEETPLWDQREGSLQVTEATGSTVRVRALVSARDSSAQWELRCLVREKLVTWLQRTYPSALPRTRAEVSGLAAPAPVTPPEPEEQQPAPGPRQGR